MAVIYTVDDDDSRLAGKRWCEKHGIDPNEVCRVEDHGAWALVTFYKLNAEGRRYIVPGTRDEVAKRIERIDL